MKAFSGVKCQRWNGLDIQQMMCSDFFQEGHGSLITCNEDVLAVVYVLSGLLVDEGKRTSPKKGFLLKNCYMDPL